MQSIFESEETKYVATENSQNMALLNAAINHNPNPPTGGGGVVVVGSALLSGSGPGAPETGGRDKRVVNDQISIYVVREGDSLSQIADMFGVSTNTIRYSNDISGSGITSGQRLVILPISGVRHTVEEGETLSEISEKYDVKLEEIRRYNDISSNASIVAGDTITVPDGEKGLARHANDEGSASGASSGGARVVRPSYSGYYARPISGGVRTQGLHGYNGIDLAAGHGSTIRAAAAGTVIVSKGSGWNGGYGKYVVIKHANGTQTLYAHNSQNLVNVGDTVSQSEAIARMGSTGKSTGTHVHFEVRGAKNPF